MICCIRIEGTGNLAYFIAAPPHQPPSHPIIAPSSAEPTDPPTDFATPKKEERPWLTHRKRCVEEERTKLNNLEWASKREQICRFYFLKTEQFQLLLLKFGGNDNYRLRVYYVFLTALVGKWPHNPEMRDINATGKPFKGMWPSGPVDARIRRVQETHASRVPIGYTSVKTLSLVLAGAMSSKKHQAPVEPKPSAERSVASRSSTSCTDAQAIRSSTS